MKIQPIVEGHGEVKAVPVLLRRLRDEAQSWAIDVNPPIRRPRGDFLDEAKLRIAVRLARKQRDCAAILVLFDSDDDCAKDLADRVRSWVRAECTDLPSEVVLPVKEYEAWFLSALESLRGCRGVRMDAVSYPNPEMPRGAKSKLEGAMNPGRSYSETVDQAALTAQLDLATAYRNSRSFRKLVKDVGFLMSSMGQLQAEWPPAAWLR